MIAKFPNAYEDELLYSLIARCASLLDERNGTTLSWLLYGTGRTPAHIVLPQNLGSLASKILGPYRGQAGRIAQELTLFPFLSPFMSETRRQSVYEGMTRTAEKRTDTSKRKVGLLKINQTKHLRLCPDCWQDDRLTKGAQYWRRTHQCPGVFTCPTHKVPLWRSSISKSFRQTYQQYLDASDVRLKTCSKIEIPASALPGLNKVSEAAKWLLSANRYQPGPDKLREAYVTALSRLGFFKGPFLRVESLRKYVSSKIGLQTLSWLAAESGLSTGFAWLERLLQGSRTNRAPQPPLRHLLLIQVLELNAEQFFHFTELLPPIDETSDLLWCPRHHAARNRSQQVNGWWMDNKISIIEMARRLRVSWRTVNLIAANSGLRFPRIRLAKKAVVYTRKLRTEQRGKYSKLRQAHPQLGVSALTEIDSCLINWLRSHDWIWLKANRPKRKVAVFLPVLNWASRDSHLAARLDRMILNGDLANKPLLYPSTIESLLKSHVVMHAKKLPKTMALLNLLVRRRKVRKKTP